MIARRIVALTLSISSVSSFADAAPPEEPAPTAAEPPPAPEPSETDRFVNEARLRFDQGDYEGAIQAFARAYEIEPDPNLLYNIGRIYEETGDFKEAIAFYLRFAKQPSVGIDLRRRALDRITVLKKVLEESGELPTESTTTDSAIPVKPDAPVTTPEVDPAYERRSKIFQITGFSLLGGGAAIVIGGAISGGLASRDANELSQSSTVDGRQDLIDRGKRRAAIADILYLTGAVIGVTGLSLAMVGVARRQRRSRARARWVPSIGPQHAGAAVHVTF